MLSKDGSMIYVGGNPDLYPLEYYDTHSGSYEGAITEFLDGFAAEYGYELQYLKPGETDDRRQYARNRQVDKRRPSSVPISASTRLDIPRRSGQALSWKPRRLPPQVKKRIICPL